MGVERRRRRQRAPLQTKRVLPIALMITSVAQNATATSEASNSDDDDDEGTSTSSDSTNTATSKGATNLVASLEDGDAVLIHHRKSAFWSGSPPCDNFPFILTKGGVSNKNCAGHFDGAAVSCTCLSGIQNQAEWKFQVKNSGPSTGPANATVSGQSSLQISKIAPFHVMSKVTRMTIIVDKSSALPITFTNDFRANGKADSPALETGGTSPASSFTVVEIANMAMSDLIKTGSFFRAELTSLTLRNCSLDDDAGATFKTLGSLTTINLESNQFTKIPSDLLILASLTSINLRGNPIASVSVTEREYQTILALKTLSMNVTATSLSDCTGGVIKRAQGFQFCVTDGAAAASAQGQQNTTTVPITDGNASSSTTKYLLIGVICGCVVVAVLLFLVVRRRNSRQKEEAFVKDTTAFSLLDDTVSFDNSKDSSQSVTSALLNDPIIITHRLPYNDVKVATCISRGGFGLVYSGTFNRRRVAIKKIRPELAGDIKHIEAFLKEICLMASLSHPRIVEFVGVSWDSLRNLSAVTEFMERGDLRDVLHSAKERSVRLSWESHKARIAMHVAEALTYLHSLSPKVIHRDLKSKNVLLDNEMTAKLSDFGVSRERRFEETHMTAGIGTAFWIAPEVLLGMDYDERADIFSFGVVLSELDTDDYPYWNAKNPAEGGKQQENVILRMVATGALRPEFSATCPESVLKLAGACLDVDPEKRPTAAQIVYTLQQLIRSSPLEPHSSMGSSLYET